jgi:glycosyltransferase involved in cell wall biosynthesis
MNVLHIIGGDLKYGASKGVLILHNALLKQNIDSNIINDANFNNKISNIHSINNKIFHKYLNIIFYFLERLIKKILCKEFKSTFTMNLLGVNFKNLKIFKEADIIHLHWLNQGFVNLNHLQNLDKPIVWTLRDMWPFTGGCHYSSGCNKYTHNCGSCPVISSTKEFDISSKIQAKKIKFVNSNNSLYVTAISTWLANLGKKSRIFKNKEIIPMGNNVDVKNFYPEEKKESMLILGINTKKKILVYGSQNPQDKRKGWDLLIQALKKLDLSKYYLVVFGNFWSKEILKSINIEFMSCGYVNDNKKMRNIYSCADAYLGISIEDGWPKSFAEAILCGAPIISFKDSSIGEVMKNINGAFIVDKTDSIELSKMIEKATDNRIYKKKIIEDSKKMIINNYSDSAIAKKYIELYKKII